MMKTTNHDASVIDLNVKAPEFRCTDIFGRPINLVDYRGKRLLLGFFRHAGCPFCNLRVHALQRIRKEMLALNLEMIFFFESNERLLQSSTFHQEVSPIPLIADPQKVWYETYGIENSWTKSMAGHLTSFIRTALTAKKKNLPMHMMKDHESFSTIPAEFLLDENLIIRHIHHAENLSDRLSLDVIRQFAAEGMNKNI